MGMPFIPVSLLALQGVCYAQIAAPVLDPHAASMTAYLPTQASPINNLRPRAGHRATDLDGGARFAGFLGLNFGADWLGGSMPGGRRLDAIDLVNGAYAPTEVDLSMSALGLPVYVGRSYSARQANGTANHTSDGVMGKNWALLTQPELLFVDSDANASTKQATDAIYLVFGPDRYVEFVRTAVNSNEFKAKNGAAGLASVVEDANGPDSVIVRDRQGNRATFFGFDTAASLAAGQLWSTTDRAGYSATVNGSSLSAALTTYTNNGGRITSATDASGRLYTFTYVTVAGKSRLSSVVASEGSNTVSSVSYTYHTNPQSTDGQPGDLATVTITTPMTSGADLVRTKYYRYYTQSWSNLDGSRGSPHQLKMVIGFEGIRRLVNGLPSSLDFSVYTDAELLPYTEAYFEYVSASDSRIASATFNGECGCAGGTTGTYTFTYATNPSYVNNTGYDTAWATRTVVRQPDGVYQTHYFDEVGQILSKITTNTDPAGSPSQTWPSVFARNSSGLIEHVYTPAATSGYNHTTGVIGAAGTGLVTSYGRIATGNLAGLRTSVSVRNGIGGSPTLVNAMTVNERQLVVGATGISMPEVASSSQYPDGVNANTTTYAYAYWEDTVNTNPLFLSPKLITTNQPAVSVANNGANVTTTTKVALRADGSTALQQDAMGVISYSKRDIWGRSVLQVTDVDTNNTNLFNNDFAPSEWALASSGFPLSIQTTTEFDKQDRPVSMTSPAVTAANRTARMAYVVASNGRMATLSFPRFDNSMYFGPAQINIANLAGKSELSATIDMGTSGSSSLPGTTPTTSWANINESVYDSAGIRLLESRRYFADYNASGTKYDATTYGYDSMGRKNRVIDPTGTISRTTFDARGLAIESSIGTNDTGANDMTVIEKREYDGAAGASGGNGWLTKTLRDADGNWGTTGDQRVTQMSYDFRGRAGLVVNPVAPHTVTKFDNLGRAIATGQYSSASGLSVSTDPVATATNRMALSETSYDQRGRVHSSTQHGIDPTTGASDGTIISRNWYDARGQTVKSTGNRITKTEYDRLGRTIGTYLIAQTAASPTYTSALSVGSSDTVVEETRHVLDPETGASLLSFHFMRAHDHSGTGKIFTGAVNSSFTLPANPTWRVQISANWYDALDRVITSGNYGHGNVTNYGGTPPSPLDSPDILVTSTAFDGLGRAFETTAPDNKKSRTEFDRAGRVTRQIANYDNGVPGPTDKDAVTEFTYANGLRTVVARKGEAVSNDQITTSVYGTIKGTAGNQISTGHLLLQVVQPPQSAGQSTDDRTTYYAYNALSEVTQTTDMAKNIIQSIYDAGGRVTTRTVSQFGSGFDTRVKSITMTYDGLGRMINAKQLNSSNVVLDETSYTFNAWGAIDNHTVDPDSAIGASGRAAFTTTMTGSSYISGSRWQGYRWASTTYPSGRFVANEVMTNSIDEMIGRAGLLSDDTYAFLAFYRYLGASTATAVNLLEASIVTGPQNHHTASSAAFSSNLDRFNRPTQLRWTKLNYDTNGQVIVSKSPAFVDQSFNLNQASQVTELKDKVLKSGTTSTKGVFDLKMTYDGLRRLTDQQEGHLSGTPWTLQSGDMTRNEIFSRDLFGRVTQNKIDLDANGSFKDGPPSAKDFGEMDDTRTYNARGQLVSRLVADQAAPNGATIALVYDRNGNLTDDGEKYLYVYTPFGQLVQVKDRVSPEKIIAEYTYSAMGTLLSERLDTNRAANDGIGDNNLTSADPVFYVVTDTAGRRIETYRGSDSEPKEVFYYHQARVFGSGGGGPLLRTRDSADQDPTKWATQAPSGTHDERYYYATDSRGRPVALVSAEGKLVEQYRYSGNGMPFTIPLGDVNADGKVESKDASDPDREILDYLVGKTYEARGDLDLNGIVEPEDGAIASGANTTVGGRGTDSIRKVSASFVSFHPNDPRLSMAVVQARHHKKPGGEGTRPPEYNPDLEDVLVDNLPANPPTPPSRNCVPEMYLVDENGRQSRGTISGSYMWSSISRLHTYVGTLSGIFSAIANNTAFQGNMRATLQVNEGRWGGGRIPILGQNGLSTSVSTGRYRIACDRNCLPYAVPESNSSSPTTLIDLGNWGWEFLGHSFFAGISVPEWYWPAPRVMGVSVKWSTSHTVSSIISFSRGPISISPGGKAVQIGEYDESWWRWECKPRE
jgi:hypothetical protein